MAETQHSQERMAALIVAGIAEGAHTPEVIPNFIAETDATPLDAVKALKAEKPYLFNLPDARKMTPQEYKAAKEVIRRTGAPPRR
jgi:hypothetical protein